MNIVDIINKKRLKKELNYKELEFVINGYINSDIKSYQLSALLMAMNINGMSGIETINFTELLIKNKNNLKLNEIVVTYDTIGGIENKTSLILISILASLGIKVSEIGNKKSGSVVSKLKAIPHINTKFELNEYVSQLSKTNLAVATKIDHFDLSNCNLYKLMQETGTINSIPLLASLIMSKNICSGSDVIIIDIKVAKGGFIPDSKTATKLAKLMIKIGKFYKKTVICILTNADEILGYSIGNSLEINESLEALKGNGSKDLLEMVLTVSSIIIGAIKKISPDDAKTLVFKQLNNRKAYSKFLEFIKIQGGSLDDLVLSNKVFSIKSDKEGYINKIDIMKLEAIAAKIGAIKNNFDDKISSEVGLKLSKKVGDYIEKEEELLKVYLKDKDVSISEILECYKIDSELTPSSKLIIDIIK